MHLLDNFIKDKFLHNISLLINQYNLSQNLTSFGKLLQFLNTSEYFSIEIFEIYKEHYQSQFLLLEILANKQGLDIHRQVFNIIRNHISQKNIKLNLSDIVNIYISHKCERIVITPEEEKPSGLYFINPK